MVEYPICVEIVHRETKIGDTLCTLPLIMQIVSVFAGKVQVCGAFAASVIPLLPDPRPLFCPPAADAALMRLDIEAAYHHGRRLNLHMTEALCDLAGWPAPPLPILLPLAASTLGLPPGRVLSPFSGSSNPWYKVWPHECWLGLVRAFVANHDDPVYLLAPPHEDTSSYVEAGAIPLIGLSLPQVLDVMLSAKLFVSIDNGLSHLAHFGGVARHLLLYPELLPARLVVNPRARVLRGRPEQIGLADVLAHAEKMLCDEAVPIGA